jgi:histone-lysine N-methyltransferase SETMAR
LLHYDNAIQLEELKWELLEHPPYSPELDPSDFHLFSPLKTHLGVKRFTGEKEVETEERKWLRQQSKYVYAAGFDALAKRWAKCINIGAYVEK